MFWGIDMRANFFESDTADISAYQYDYGQKLEIEGLELENGFEVHFQNGTGSPEIRQGTVENNMGIVAVPDITLSLESDVVTAWVYVKTADSGTTVKTINIELKHREKPSDSPCIADYPQIKAYADYVKENAEKVAEAQAVADKLKADAAAGLFNGADGKDGAEGPQGIQGPPGKDGADGRGIETIAVTTEDELVAAMEKITSEFTVGTVASVIGTGTLLGLKSPFSDVDLSALTAERVIIDRGSGNIREALVLNNYVHTTTLIQSISRNIQALKEQTAANAEKNVINHYPDLQKAYDAADTAGINFSSIAPKRIRLMITLPASDVPVKINIGTIIDLADRIGEGSELCFEADLFAKNAIRYSYTLSDADKNVVKSVNMLKRSSIAKISRFALRGYETGKTFTAVYVGAGN